MDQKFHDNEYLNLIRRVLETGAQKGDRTGTGTISKFAEQLRFDLTGNSIPLLTTKKMHTKSIIHELLWFLAGDTNIKYLNDNGVRIWNEWSSPEGNLNNVYGAQWRRWEKTNWMGSVEEIKLRTDQGIDKCFIPERLTTPRTPPKLDPTDDIVGTRRTNNDGHSFVVIQKIVSTGAKNSKYLIEFEKTGSQVEVLRPNLRRGQVSDPHTKTVFGEGCIGVYNEHPTYYTQAYNLWYNMMKRCYDTTYPEYQLYGGDGVFVCQQWRCFSNFLRDIHNIPFFNNWAEQPSEYDLDKDYYVGKCYSPSTCIFLPKHYNRILSNLTGSKYIATHNETGEIHEFTVQRWFAEQVGIEHSQVISTALKSKGKTKNWTFTEIQPQDGYIFRQQMVVDQIAQVINQLRNNPNDRRIIVSAWNVGEIDQMALPPCHAFFQFWSRELTLSERTDWFSDNGHGTKREDTESDDEIHAYYDKHNVPRRALSCHLYQRSCDIGLGVPFNVAQYSILVHMIAQVTGHIAEEFIWTGGDTHVYNNHIDQLTSQVDRTPFASPILLLNSEVKEIEDFTFDDFKVIDYVSHPTIKMAVSV